MPRSRQNALWSLALLAVVGGLLVTSGCRRPRDGRDGSSGVRTVVIIPPSDTEVDDSEPLPGININVVSLEGGGDGERFNAGDEMKVTFTITRNDGSLMLLSELDHFEGWISGPTFNYQIVVPEQEDIRELAEANEDGSYSYSFPALPEYYPDPPNYTGAFTTDVLSGTELLDGTYSLVLVAYRNYSVGGSKILKDVGNTVHDFLYGDSPTAIESRAVVQLENCAQCHDQLQQHTEGLPGGGIMRDPRVCVTCHVAGAEDLNDPLVGGGTPDTTIEFKVMIHKIHNSANLPSQLGIATNPDGSRDYNAPRLPYELANEEGEVEEFEIQFPVWPNLNVLMPRDYGYTLSEDPATTAMAYWDGVAGSFKNYTRPDDSRSWRSMDDATRRGVTDCAKCHGDPDDDGPLAAPAQGDLSYVQPTRRACGSCHDDIDWALPYRSNLKTMDAQADDSSCISCHVGGSDPKIDSVNAHVHPLLNTSLMPTAVQGINVEIVAVHPSAGPTLEPNEKLEVVFTVKDDAGNDITLTPAPYPGLPKFPTNYGPPGGTTAIWPYPWPVDMTGWWSTFSLVVSGPTQNYNLLNYVTVPMLHPSLNAGVPVDGEYHLNVPEIVLFERLGRATAGADSWATARTNHLNVPFYAPTFVLSRAAAPSAPAVSASDGFALASPVAVGQSWIDIVDTTVGVGYAWAKGQYVCLNDLATTGVFPGAVQANEEYLRIQAVEPDINGTTNDRLWFTSPYQTNSVTSNADTTGTPPAGALPSTGPFGPWARFAHAAGEPITRVAVTVLATSTWTLGGVSNNLISEAGAGWTTDATILTCYTGDWQCPSVFPITFNSSPDLNETWGKWEGKRIIPGTYTVGLWTRFPWRYTDPDHTPWTPVAPVPAGKDPGPNFENNSYPITSSPANADFLVNNPVLNGAPYLLPVPSEIEAYETLATHGETCYECHNDMWFHGGGRRGFDTCIMCHGVAGSEDWPRYRSASPITPATTVLPTPGLTINFRTMLHKIHTGKNLYYASTYYIVGNSGNAGAFDEIGFPVETGYGAAEGTRNCAKCHGEPEPGHAGSWVVPRNRNHPTDQGAPAREWMVVCNSCHDSGDTTAHIALMTAPTGEESCATCHGPGATYGVEIMHKPK